jgi:large-conductance mechanosensitive channel
MSSVVPPPSFESICRSTSLGEFLSERNLFGTLLALAISSQLTGLISGIVNDAISPFIGLCTGNNLNNQYIVLKNGQNAPYSTSNTAINDNTAIVFKWGAILLLIITFLLVIATFYVLTKVMCFESRNRKITNTISQMKI